MSIFELVRTAPGLAVSERSAVEKASRGSVRSGGVGVWSAMRVSCVSGGVIATQVITVKPSACLSQQQSSEHRPTAVPEVIPAAEVAAERGHRRAVALVALVGLSGGALRGEGGLARGADHLGLGDRADLLPGHAAEDGAEREAHDRS